MAVAVVGAALLIPLGVSAPAQADTPSGPEDGTGTRTIEFGRPEKVETVKEQTASGIDATAVDCSVGQVKHDRLSSCSYYRIPVQFFINGTPSGTATLYSKATAELNPRNRYEWKQKVELRLTDPSVPEAWAVSATISLDCNYCRATSGGTRLLFPYTTQTFEMTVSSPGRALVNDSIVPRGVFKAPRYDDGAAYVGEVFRPRCDNTPRITPVAFGGCVYPDVPPIWQIDVTNPRVDAVGWHVLWAQKNLNHPWGVPGSGYPLHRTFDNTLINDNRGVACGRDVPRPPDPTLSCDEYPFAQSYEGASRNPDYSCHFLDRWDNSREGSLRKAFLNSMRTLENDAFHVEVINVPATTPTAPNGAIGPMGPVGCGSD
ncbi:NucA/NucB deoxyribonuclease domain-containing protein [Micromonospora fulviviridis]|uniref:Deoxyribonuclease NucA/NucB domain-containing protein n=1 Tax=Micromonospora fulviviridis TaxID=47860 RepID=A0ABV2VVQ6_9ACTN